LSPDGKTLVVAPTASTYVLVDTTSLTQLSISGPIDLPVWSPDSSWLAYTARTASGGYEVRRINRDGSGDARVLSGAARPQIAPDGQRIAVNQSIDPTSTDILRVFDNGYNGSRVVRPVANGKGAQTFAWAAGGVLYFAKDRIGTAAGWIGVTDKGVTKSSVISTLPLTDPPVSPGDLYPSPDGSKVLFSMTGDDGHSRLYVADTSAKKVIALTSLYDEYPKAWVLDGTAVLFIRGNAIQNETTALWKMNPNNTGRTELVKNAGL
jgi:Tol biopolymer transport system component